MNMSKNLKYDMLIDAAYINATIRHLKLNPSVEEKDKMIDQLLIKRCERIRDELTENAVKGLNYIKENDSTSQR